MGFAVRKFTKFSVFLALKYTPITGLTDITEFRKKNKKGGGGRVTEILHLHALSVFEVKATEAKTCKFARAEPKQFEIEIYLFTEKRPFGRLKSILF